MVCTWFWPYILVLFLSPYYAFLKIWVSLVYILLITILTYSVLEFLIYCKIEFLFVISSTSLASVLFQVDERTSFDLILNIIYLINDFIKFGRRPQRQCGLIAMFWFSRIDYVYLPSCCFPSFPIWRCQPY